MEKPTLNADGTISRTWSWAKLEGESNWAFVLIILCFLHTNAIWLARLLLPTPCLHLLCLKPWFPKAISRINSSSLNHFFIHIFLQQEKWLIYSVIFAPIAILFSILSRCVRILLTAHPSNFILWFWTYTS